MQRFLVALTFWKSIWKEQIKTLLRTKEWKKKSTLCCTSYQIIWAHGDLNLQPAKLPSNVKLHFDLWSVKNPLQWILIWCQYPKKVWSMIWVQQRTYWKNFLHILRSSASNFTALTKHDDWSLVKQFYETNIETNVTLIFFEVWERQNHEFDCRRWQLAVTWKTTMHNCFLYKVVLDYQEAFLLWSTHIKLS